MDTMKLLLGATIALLVGAVALSWHGMKQGVETAPASEIARLRKQVDELRLEQDRLQLEKQRQTLRSIESTQAPAVITNAEREALKAELAAKDAALRAIEDERAKAERDVKTLDEENVEFHKRDLEKSDGELRRARLIGEALLMGKVKEVAQGQEYGDFVTFEILMPDSLQAGSILAIRRKTGIIGRLKVAEITAEGGIANILPGIAAFTPQAGDELILPPDL